MQTKDLIQHLAYGSFKTVELQQRAADFATRINNILLDLSNTQSKISRKKKYIKQIRSDIQELEIIYIKTVYFVKRRAQYKNIYTAIAIFGSMLRSLRFDLEKHAHYQRVLEEEVAEIGRVLSIEQHLAQEFLAKTLDSRKS